MDDKPDGRWFVNAFNPEDKVFGPYNDEEPAYKAIGPCERCGKPQYRMRVNGLIRPERYIEEMPSDGCLCQG